MAEGRCIIFGLGLADNYQRFAFVPASSFRISCQTESVPANIIMALAISTDRSMKDIHGIIRYRDEFDAAMSSLI